MGPIWQPPSGRSADGRFAAALHQHLVAYKVPGIACVGWWCHERAYAIGMRHGLVSYKKVRCYTGASAGVNGFVRSWY